MDARSGFWKYALVLTVLGVFTVMVLGAAFSFDEVPPVPQRIVVEPTGQVLDGAVVALGQSAWQRYGLMDYGSVLGNGGMRGPDFTAQTLRLMAEAMQAYHAQQARAAGEPLSAAELAARVQAELSANRYDPATRTLTISAAEAFALEQVEAFYRRLFAEGDPEASLPAGLVAPGDVPALSRFFFWTAWLSAARRPGQAYSYTNNWPYEPAAGNHVTPGSVVASAVSVALLVAMLAVVLWAYFRYRLQMEPELEPDGPSAGLHDGAARRSAIGLPDSLTPTQRAAAKFLVVVMLLFLGQTLMGGWMAHSYVAPDFFGVREVLGIPIDRLLPFSVARSWHLQMAIFWIATAWLAAGLYIAPALSRQAAAARGQAAGEPRAQALLANVLFVALVLVTAGTLAGIYLGGTGRLSAGSGEAGSGLWWWVGHQGWEYLELGRLWQILLIVGLLLWLIVVWRGIRAALRAQQDPGSLPHLLLYASAAIPFFYGFGLFFKPGTNWAVAEFWRWWVIHLWVEGIFEVFALVVTATLLVHLGLVRAQSALRATYFQILLVMATGVIGTAHHYYFVGLPEFWLALGAAFSALEVVPLTLLGVEAYEQHVLARQAGRSFAYPTVFWFLVATAVWNVFGAGVLGFFINLPVVNYFEHGTFLTAAHAHAALMGVYGMLAMALLVYVLRSVTRPEAFSERAVRLSFWGLNAGLAGMVLLTLIPVGIGQLAVAVDQGFAVARDPAFYRTPWVQVLLWLRMLPDTVLIVLGVLPMLWAVVKGLRGLRPADEPVPAAAAVPAVTSVRQAGAAAGAPGAGGR